MPKAHMVASIKACLQVAPLGLSDVEFKSLQLTAHSEHGSPSDMLATIGPHSHLGSFIREDVREIGHWLRLGNLEEQLEGGTAGAQARRRGAPAGRQATGAFGNNAAECARPATVRARVAKDGAPLKCECANAGLLACGWRWPNGLGRGRSCHADAPTTEFSRRRRLMSDSYLHSDQLYTLGVWEGLRMSWSLGGISFQSLSARAQFALSFSPIRLHHRMSRLRVCVCVWSDLCS